MICIKLPKPTIENVEVFVRKVPTNFVYVILYAQFLQNLKEVRVFEVSVSNFTIVICVEFEKDAHYYCISIPVLKLRRLLQEFKTRMMLQ